MKPLVSVVCITYNQEKTIAQAIDSFLMQETNFPFEIIIHDDASTDTTPSIIKKYAKKYPKLFKVIFEDQNQYSKKTWQFVNDMLIQARGKYIAMCEGDDFWTDSKKLQKQVDFMEGKPDYSVCFHSVRVFFENNEESQYISPIKNKAAPFNIENLLKDNYINTCSVMYRKQNYNDLINGVMPQDVYLHLYHARFGKIGFIKDVMSAYRRQSEGIWWESREHMDKIYIKYHHELINLYAELLKMFEGSSKYEAVIRGHLRYLLGALLDIDHDNNSDIMVQTARNFPSIVQYFTNNQLEFIRELQSENERLSKLSYDLAGVREELSHVTEELNSIKKSKWYKLNPMRVLRNLND